MSFERSLSDILSGSSDAQGVFIFIAFRHAFSLAQVVLSVLITSLCFWH